MSQLESVLPPQPNDDRTQARVTLSGHPASDRLAWLLFGLTWAFTALDLIFLALNGSVSLPMTLRGAPALWALAYAAIGQFLARKLPQNAIGWLFLLFGLITGAMGFGAEYAAYVVLVHPGALPGGTLAAWLVSWIWISMIGISVYIFFLFPTGHLPSARWRPVAWAAAGVFALMIVAQMFKPGPLRFAPYLDNPIAVAGSDAVLSFISVVGYTTGVLCQLAAAASVVVRLRGAKSVERQQLKWFAYTATLLGVVGFMQSVPGAFNLAVPEWWNLFNFLLPVVIGVLPFTVGMAMLRYRLYEIDRIINHSLVYGTLSVCIVITYVLSVGLLGALLNANVSLAAAIVTIVLTALLFQPLRAQLQRSLNRARLGVGDTASPNHEIEESHSASAIPLRWHWLPWLLFILTCALTALGLLFLALSWSAAVPDTFAFRGHAALLALAFGGVGQFLARHRWQNSIGWLFLVAGLVLSVQEFGQEYAAYMLLVRADALPGTNHAAWIASWIPTVFLGSMMSVVLLFPTGRLPSERWRPFLWIQVALWAATTFGSMIKPGPLRFAPYLDNPFAGSQRVWELLMTTTGAALTISIVVMGVSVIVRLRRSSGIERQQLKWFSYTAALVCVVGIIYTLAYRPLALVRPELIKPIDILAIIIPLAMPFAVALAILRYRLYAIDRVINRTLVYGTLTAGIVALYILLVGALGALSQSSGNLLISLLATGLIAVLFQPLRERFQRGVNRLLYGERDEPYALMARLGRDLETTIAPAAILDTLVHTIAQALKLPYVAIETSRGADVEIAAAYGQPPSKAQRIPLAHQSETVGQLLVAPRSPHEPLSAPDLNLLHIIAQQAGLAVHAVQLSADLQRSREQLVTSREEERRRIRRDLHDGLGPALASLAMQADSAREWTHTDPERAEAALADMTVQTQAALQDIRRLVYGLRPPALDELGLVGALRQTAANYAGEVQIDIDAPEPLPSLPAAVEVAAYRIAQETLNNVMRHAQARHCSLRVCVQDLLQLVITDDGVGLPSALHAGVGLLSMRERAAELGGSCVIESVQGGGTRVTARLPLVKV